MCEYILFLTYQQYWRLGIETFFYYLAKKYAKKDITIVYRDGDFAQLKRLKPHLRCLKYRPGMKIKCENAFFNFNLDIIDDIDAEKDYVLVLHGDYKDMVKRGQIASPPKHPKITKVVGVSKLACDSYEELTGIKCELCYNPVELDKPRRVLNLISATRLSAEKGRSRMVILANALDAAGIPYTWTIFTNSKDIINNDNIVYRKPRLDILGYIQNADALVQLSDNEGYCYSVIEAACLGKPVIITKCPVFDELGFDETNSIKLDFDMSNLNPEELYEKVLNMKVKYTPKKDRWDELFADGESTYKYNPDEIVNVEVTKKFYDMQNNGKQRFVGEHFDCKRIRADELIEAGIAKIPL